MKCLSALKRSWKRRGRYLRRWAGSCSAPSGEITFLNAAKFMSREREIYSEPSSQWANGLRRGVPSIIRSQTHRSIACSGNRGALYGGVRRYLFRFHSVWCVPASRSCDRFGSSRPWWRCLATSAKLTAESPESACGLGCWNERRLGAQSALIRWGRTL